MRPLLLTLAIGFAAAPSYAGDLYYIQTGGDRNVYAVSVNADTPRIVLASSEYTGNVVRGVTRYNHAGSNGQAFLQTTGNSLYNDPADIQLLWRGPDGAISTKRITDLSANTLLPYGFIIAQDDSFFSLKVHDFQGRNAIYRLNVSVDQALAADYVPPTRYDDPRMTLVYSVFLDPKVGPNSLQHDWSGDGTRLVYENNYVNSTGTFMTGYFVKRLSDGATVLLYETPYATSQSLGIGLRWNPTSDQILQPYKDGSGIFMLHADTPGLKTWALQRRTYKNKTTVYTDSPDRPLWRFDGQAFAFALERTVQPNGGTATNEHYPSVTSGGWPSMNLTTTRPAKVYPIGWTP